MQETGLYQGTPFGFRPPYQSDQLPFGRCLFDPSLSIYCTWYRGATFFIL